MKRKNPYQMLLEEIIQFCRKLQFPHEREMFYYPKDKLPGNFRLDDLSERTKAADQLGYDVVLKAEDKGLIVYYRKKAPDVPYRWK